jgi:hypothetical protein
LLRSAIRYLGIRKATSRNPGKALVKSYIIDIINLNSAVLAPVQPGLLAWRCHPRRVSF